MRTSRSPPRPRRSSQRVSESVSMLEGWDTLSGLFMCIVFFRGGALHWFWRVKLHA